MITKTESAAGGGRVRFACGDFRCILTWSDQGLRTFSFRRGRGSDATAGSVKHLLKDRSLPPFVRLALRGLDDYFSGKPADLADCPLDLGTIGTFAAQVYAATTRIGYGSSASYGQVAARVGRPAAARAVGMCMKRNPLPLFIPCHRVIRKDASLGGYTSPDGVALKAWLLALEAEVKKNRGKA